MQLVYVYQWGGEPCSGTSTIPFEYESKEKFLFDLFELAESKKEETFSSAQILEEVYLSEIDLDNVEHLVHTLDEWFEKEKVRKVF